MLTRSSIERTPLSGLALLPSAHGGTGVPFLLQRHGISAPGTFPGDRLNPLFFFSSSNWNLS